MSGAEFVAWLEGITCTSPFTVLDARAFHMMIHTTLAQPGAKVDVYTTKGDVVHVRVETERGVILRDLPIV